MVLDILIVDYIIFNLECNYFIDGMSTSRKSEKYQP